MWSQKNVRIIIVSITSIEGIPGYSWEKGQVFWVPELRLTLHLEDTLALKK